MSPDPFARLRHVATWLGLRAAPCWSALPAPADVDAAVRLYRLRNGTIVGVACRNPAPAAS